MHYVCRHIIVLTAAIRRFRGHVASSFVAFRPSFVKIDHSVRKLGVVRRRLLPIVKVTKQTQGEFITTIDIPFELLQTSNYWNSRKSNTNS